MERFYCIDLASELDRLAEVPDRSFDVAILSHVLEHLPNGLDVLQAIASKVAMNGYLYIEVPSPRSLSLPSMWGTLNFFDDPTHVRLYRLSELRDVVKRSGFAILRAGRRRDLSRILLLPVGILADLVRWRRLVGGRFYDVTGFADQLLARKEP